ncbi:unnamed protein product [Blepharisma stoltei]|uniref:Phosphodiesterase n=1 Tax=Blepharisma stoltei TaxID=1481888 RepID=A0AAU9K647_9CILI|nr:unnamed protein product [Blepharisma stoltei]
MISILIFTLFLLKYFAMENLNPYETNDHNPTVLTTIECKALQIPKKRGFRSFLKFVSNDMEKSFQYLMISEEKHMYKVSENLGGKLPDYLWSYYALCLIYMLIYIVSYVKDDSSSSSFTCQISLICGQMIINSLIYWLAFSTNIFRILRIQVLSFSYIMIGAILILNNGPVQVWMLDEKSETYFSCLPGLLVLLTVSQFITHFSFANYFRDNAIIASIYIVLHLFSDQKLAVTLFEFGIFVLRIFFETRKFYIKELTLRHRFYNKQAYSEKVVDSARSEPQTEIEGITEFLCECLTLAKSLKHSPNEIEDKASLIAERIKKVLQVLKSKANIYTPNIEVITRNMTEEDKLFVKQTIIETSAKEVSSSKTKIKKRDTDRIKLITKSYNFQELEGILKQLGNNWNFDMFFLKDCSSGKPLATIGKYCIDKYVLDELLSVNENIIANFFDRLESQYNDNPYHNSTHGADVLASVIYFIKKSVLSELLDDIDLLAVIVATLGHDVGHPGLTNRFLINNHDTLAIEYNDISVLEMMHSSSIFIIMKALDADIFQNLSPEHYTTVRKLIIEMVLGTDMSKHWDFLTAFKAKNVSGHLKQLETADQKIDVLKLIVKGADIGHSAKSQDLHKKWSFLVIEEFFNQGDIEKMKKLPVSMYCDRNNTDIPKSQIGFIKNIVLPLYEVMSNYLASELIEENCVKEIQNNLVMWESETLAIRCKTMVPANETLLVEKLEVESPGERKTRRYGTSRALLDPTKISWED